MNADGSDETQVTHDGVGSAYPTWSPDGTRLAFVRVRAQPPTLHGSDIYLIDADGTNETPLIADGTRNFNPSWSPDGSQLAFDWLQDCDCPRRVAVINVDGTGFHDVGPTGSSNPDWDPSGQQIVYGLQNGLWIMNRDGSGAHQILNSTSVEPAWSPDGKRIAFKQLLPPNNPPDIHLINPDGTREIALTDPAADLMPAWQPILKGYARPKGAGTLYAPLVPAYNACTSPNRQHAAPLQLRQLQPAHADLDPADRGDSGRQPEARRLGRLASDRSDPRRRGPTGRRRGEPDHLDHRCPQRLRPHRLHRQPRDASPASDHRQVQHPVPRRTGTGHRPGLHLRLERPLHRHRRSQHRLDCSLATTADTLLPGSALEGRRAIWQTQEIEVRDGAGHPFMRQGVFVP